MTEEQLIGMIRAVSERVDRVETVMVTQTDLNKLIRLRTKLGVV